jgi:hypothetical protein
MQSPLPIRRNNEHRLRKAAAGFAFLLLMGSVVVGNSVARVDMSAGEPSSVPGEFELVGSASGDPHGGQGKTDVTTVAQQEQRDTSTATYVRSRTIGDRWAKSVLKRVGSWFSHLLTATGGH